MTYKFRMSLVAGVENTVMSLADRQTTTPLDCGILDCDINVAGQVVTKIQRNT